MNEMEILTVELALKSQLDELKSFKRKLLTHNMDCSNVDSLIKKLEPIVMYSKVREALK